MKKKNYSSKLTMSEIKQSGFRNFLDSLLRKKSEDRNNNPVLVVEERAIILEELNAIEISKKFVIIGAGISGLASAKELTERGESDFVVIEASDLPGGRVKTDIVDGFLLDRGFQVFIESYPEAINLFDYEGLKLSSFLPGAIVRYNNEFHLVSDPFRRPQDLIASLFTPIGSFADKVLVGLFSVIIRFLTLEEIFNNEELNTVQYLENKGD